MNFNRKLILLNNNVDGEGHTCRPNPVKQAHCNNLDCGVDMATDSLGSSQFLSASLSFVNLEPLFFLFKETQLCPDVIRVFLEGSSGTPHDPCVPPQSNVSIFWESEILIVECVLTVGVATKWTFCFFTRKYFYCVKDTLNFSLFNYYYFEHFF